MDELYFFSGYDLKIAVVVNAHIFGKGIVTSYDVVSSLACCA